jgi:polyvinyl alcohol dehydrogenase (cytochrome)
MPRMPSREALGTLTPEHIDTALSSFNMRKAGRCPEPGRAASGRRVSVRATGRSYRAPLEAIARSAYCSAGAAAPRDLLTGPAWNGWGGDLRNSRYQPAAAAGLAAGDIPRLKLKWALLGFQAYPRPDRR